MIRSDRLFFTVMFGAIIFIPIGIILKSIFDFPYIYDYHQFFWVFLLPYVIVKVWFPNSKASEWFHSVPEKVIYFYKNTYDKIKLYRK